ncbi:SprT protein [Pseudomonas duriflava]|uniref:SprT protein n=1 Tax=Pseudomonas duriflava TaxID=459528 RepID=A0A562QAM0_9PSED|nr:SprT family zinc-dependent metalloprotease [Pseudomonas duriflava]TWI53773.1 SprT protein [Pseudomonas duriflava]
MAEALLARVEACFQRAEQYFKRPFTRAQVSLRLRGQRAGVAHLNENLLRFNETLYRNNQEHFLKQTVAHEVAHLVAHQLFGMRIKPHGEEWQNIMRAVYGLEPNRCHTYEIERPSRTVYLYRCGCQDSPFPFTARRHSLVTKGQRYSCRRCRSPLSYTGQTRLEQN